MQINLNFDASVSSASWRWVASLEQAAKFLDAIIPDRITVNFDIGYGEVHGQALGQDTLGATSNTGYNVSYDQLVGALEAHPTSALDQQFLSFLPSTDPNNGKTWFVPSAEAKILGLVPANANTVDAYVGLTSTIPTYYDPDRVGVPTNSTDLIGVAIHELTHGLGRALGGSLVEPMDLMAYGANRQVDPDNSHMRFISYDGGRTSIGTLDASSDASDLAEGSPADDPFNAYMSPGIDYAWTATDTAIMQMLGYHVDTGSSAVADALASAGLDVNDFLPPVASSTQHAAAATNFYGGTSDVPDTHAHWLFPTES